MKRHIRPVAIASLLLLLLVTQGQACGPLGGTFEDLSSNSAFSRRARCLPPAGVSGSPKTIAEAVALINALPKPLSIPCFLESLDRPLKVYASRSTASAQPADGPESPRIFIFNEGLVMAVAPVGLGASAIELSEARDPGMSAKGELSFPIDDPIPEAAAFQQIREGTGTSCRVCHTSEVSDSRITYAQAFVSRAIRPNLNSRVDLNYLRSHAANCESVSNNYRCDMLRAVFSYGPVQDTNFPE